MSSYHKPTTLAPPWPGGFPTTITVFFLATMWLSAHIRLNIGLILSPMPEISLSLLESLCPIPLHCHVVFLRALFWGTYYSLLLPLGQIINRFSIAYNLFVDFSYNPSESFRWARLPDYLNTIRDWTTKPFLQLSADKTEILVVAPE